MQLSRFFVKKAFCTFYALGIIRGFPMNWVAGQAMGYIIHFHGFSITTRVMDSPGTIFVANSHT